MSTATRPKRLLLRLGTTCNNGCRHCPLADVRSLGLPDRTTAQAMEALRAGRRAGCRAVVFLRGEATLRSDLVDLVRQARALGFEHVQLQTNGRRLAHPAYARALAAAGLETVEISLYGPEASVHDAVARVEGAFEQSVAGIRNALALGLEVIANVHITRANEECLDELARGFVELGVRRVQWMAMRPAGDASLGARLAVYRRPLRAALQRCLRAGIVPTTEAVPTCALGGLAHLASDAWSDAHAPSVRIDDLHRCVSDVASLRREYRAGTAACDGCAWNGRCGQTWRELAQEAQRGVTRVWEGTP